MEHEQERRARALIAENLKDACAVAALCIFVASMIVGTYTLAAIIHGY